MSKFDEVLAALRKCWKPRGGMTHLDMELAWNFVGDFEEEIVEALTQAAEIERGDKVVVPRELTEDMVTAYLQPRGTGTLKEFVTEQWQAMITASKVSDE